MKSFCEAKNVTPTAREGGEGRWGNPPPSRLNITEGGGTEGMYVGAFASINDSITEEGDRKQALMKLILPQ